ncbi:caspase family protein [Geomonas silvestris]|nr:caspase family protein [Geomonas silvestris]
MVRILEVFVLGLLLQLVVCLTAEAAGSPISSAHLIMIDSMFRDNGINNAEVKLDRQGRVLLGGSYKDSREVSLAFSLAQSVVGVKWTSPVVPENVKVREWAESLALLFPTKKTEHVSKPQPVRRSGGKPEKFALVVGVGRFQNDRNGKNTLRYAADDAEQVRSYLVDYAQYQPDNVTFLVDETATGKNIQRSIEAIRQKAGEDDEVFVYFSSHGAPIYDGSLNIVTYDTVFKNHFTMAESSFPSKTLKSFLERTRAGHVYIVLDVCYSGAAFKGIDGFYHPGSKSISFDDDNQGLSREAMAKSLLGAKDIVVEQEQTSPEAREGNGGVKVIVSASDAGERSWESENYKASFFTYQLLQELKKGRGLRTAFASAKPKVILGVKEEKNADQHPQVIASKRDW